MFWKDKPTGEYFDDWAATPEGSALIAKIGQHGGVWKPIKTAPKDGNTIKVSYEIDGSDFFLVKWVDERTCAGDRKYGPGWAQTEIPAGEGLPVDEPLMWLDEQSHESSPTEASVKELMGKSWDAALFYNENTGGPADDFVPNKEEAIKMLYGKGSSTQAGEGTLKEALQQIYLLCDNQNESHETIWRIAHHALGNK